MKLGLHQSLRMEQRLVQSPQMIQAMQILQLPSLELRERIERELQENPFLEVDEEVAPPPPTPPPRDNGQDAPAPEAARLDLLERYERLLDEQGPGSRGGTGRGGGGGFEDGDAKYEALLNAPDLHVTFADRLLAELGVLDLTERERRIGEYLVHCLDDRGYLMASVEEIASTLAGELPEVTAEEVGRVLERVRTIGPPGLGARDLRECLRLQLDREGAGRELERDLVDRHLPDVANNRLPKIARETGRSIDEVKAAVEFLRGLHPRPAAGLGPARTVPIVPDLVVEEIEGSWIVRLEKGDLPPLRIAGDFRKILEEAKRDRAAFEALKRKVDSAKWLLEAIAQRASTLQKIAEEVVARQRGFLEEGPSKLKPMRMQEVADAVGVHISTVSRAIRGKYLQSPRGIVEMRSFFTGGTEAEDGHVESQTSIKERVRALVEAEDKRAPLSDEEIARRLKREGLPIARRTVTKYRKALRLPPSSIRREY